MVEVKKEVLLFLKSYILVVDLIGKISLIFEQWKLNDKSINYGAT